MGDLDTVAAAASPRRADEPDTPPYPARERVRGTTTDAWRVLRGNPVFWIAVLIASVVVAMAGWPSLFTDADPNDCDLDRQMAGPSGPAIFGFNFQGCDVYAHAVHGARDSLLVGGGAAVLAGLLALVAGMVCGYFGGWIDALLSRLVDTVLAIPLLLGAIVLMRRVPAGDEPARIIALSTVLGLLGWATAARVVRASVLSAKQRDYVAAARMLGAGHGRIMWRHLLPNVVGPFLVISAIGLGSFVASEATLSYLGVGLKAPSVSWGTDISDARPHLRERVTPLAVPSAFLALTVLAFVLLGDAIRDALDPKTR
jgi:oligopeptide transport system permease protein